MVLLRVAFRRMARSHVVGRPVQKMKLACNSQDGVPPFIPRFPYQGGTKRKLHYISALTAERAGDHGGDTHQPHCGGL